MRTRLLPLLSALVLALPAAAAELQVLAGGGFAAPLKDLAAQFEQVTGHKVATRLGTGPEIAKAAAAGDAFDVVIAPSEVFRDEAARARFALATPATIARVGFGLAVRAGQPKPDISTPDAFKRTLLAADSVAFVPASAAGGQVTRVLEKLGIAEQVRAKTKAYANPPQMVQGVASGEAQVAIFLINVLTAPGLEVAGPFPGELQQELVYLASPAKDAREPAAAKAFLEFIATPAARTVIQSKGMTPG